MTAPHPTLSAGSRHQVLAVLAVLLVLAATGWAVFLSNASDGPMDMDMAGDPGRAMDVGGGPAAMDMEVDGHHGAMDMGSGTVPEGGRGSRTPVPDLSMGGEVVPFVGSWTAMMAAMMLPAAAPMVLLYARTQPGRPLNVGLFTGSYLALWVAFGVAAFGLAVAVEELAGRHAVVADNWARIAGALIVVAGLYQLSSLKDRCLRACRSPLSFIFTAWRPGRSGAVRMGLQHGIYCAGCCWLLFVVLVPIGVMDLTAMLLVAVAIFAEKVLPRPMLSRNVIAAALVAYGTAVVVRPDLLPTVA